ncbi:DnaJ family domain-containing protein [Nocardiopsis coralliicola]
MTERKPAGEGFESWVDRLVREAEDRGEFDNLPGRGKPIPDIDRPRDDLWWVRKKAQEEGVAPLPRALALRREAEDARAAALAARTDDEARRILADVNAVIAAEIRSPQAGPPITIGPIDIDRVLEERRQRE